MSALFRHLRAYGLYRDEHEDFKDEMERIRVARGKPSKRARRGLQHTIAEEEAGKKLM